MKRFTAVVAILETLFSPFLLQAYDLSHESSKNTGPTTVALVPYANQRTDSLGKIMDRLEGELRHTRGVKVLDRAKTDAILEYYLKYVNKTAADTGIEKTLGEARQSLLAGNYAESLKSLDVTERKINARVAGGGSNEGLYQVYLLRAKIYHANGNEAALQKEYAKLVVLAPYFELDPNLYSKWERSALQSAKEKIAGEETASIEVSSMPQGSEVFLNGIHVGITPMTLKKLPPSRQIVEVKTVNHASYLAQVNLREGEKAAVRARLARTGVASDNIGNTVRPSLYRSDAEISRLISTLGYHMGVDKIVLVADKKESGIDSVVYQLGDTKLGAVEKEHTVAVSSEKPEGVALLASSINKEARADILANPGKYVDQTVGSIQLHQTRRPLYKRPLFWVLVGAGAGAGGALGAILGATGGAAATTGGVIVSL